MSKQTNVHAVISGDIVSSKKHQAYFPEIQKEFKTYFKQLESEFFPKENFIFTRGDGFQGVVDNPQFALNITFGIICFAKTMKNRVKGMGDFDVRVCIGLGEISHFGVNPLESDGSAFRLSGQHLDGMKAEARSLKIVTENENLNLELDLYCRFTEALMQKWTISGAEMMSYLLLDTKEMEIAKHLGVTQPAINSRKKSLNWHTIKHFLNRYKQLA